MANPRISLQDLPRRRTRWAWWLATCFGIGWLRPGPGTYASVAALLLWLPLMYAPISPVMLSAATMLLAVVATLVGIPAASRVAQEAGVEDPGFVVIDEAAGTWIALLAVCLPWHGWAFSPGATLPAALVALLLFRVFDIFKPWPVSALDRMHGGAGIMLDDVAAGLYAFACVLALRAIHWMR
jgi:phosphatidylglycerophosphatase A